MSTQERYDSTFLGILQNEGKIAHFLDAVFSFLYRRTDFYMLMNEPNARLGFPPGVAERLVRATFKKYEGLALENHRLQEERAAASNVPPVVREEEVCTAVKEKKAKQPAAELKKQDTTSKVEQKKTDEGQKTEEKKGEEQQRQEAEKKTEDEQSREQKAFQANPLSYNGAIRDRYSWAQSITDIDMYIKVPKQVHKGKDVQVNITRKHITAKHRGQEGQMEVIIDDDLAWEVNKEESMWSLVPGEHIHVNMEKVQERWWETALVNEEPINVRKIDPSRPITDLDDQAQAKIQEMMYNEEQKRLGRPQSHEQKVHDVLRQAWDSEGSPFKGQPFDPSKVNVAPDSGSTINMPPS